VEEGTTGTNPLHWSTFRNQISCISAYLTIPRLQLEYTKCKDDWANQAAWYTGDTSAETIQPSLRGPNPVVWQEWQAGHAGGKNWLPTAPSSERFGECLASNKETDESGGYAQNDLNAQSGFPRGHGAWED
jgi:hypothetical protein